MRCPETSPVQSGLHGTPSPPCTLPHTDVTGLSAPFRVTGMCVLNVQMQFSRFPTSQLFDDWHVLRCLTPVWEAFSVRFLNGALDSWSSSEIGTERQSVLL